MADDKKARREPLWFDDTKLMLFADPIKADAKSPRLRVTRDDNNNPVIDVDLGITTEAKFEGAKVYPIRIETPMSPRPFRELMDLLTKVGAYKGVISFEITNWGRPWIWDKDQKKNVKAKEDMIVSRFAIAKTEAGLVTFGVAAARGNNSVTFEFKPDRYHALTQNGQDVSVAIGSGTAAGAWAGFMTDAFCTDYVQNWVEPEWKKEQRRQRAQQFGGNGGGGGGNNYQQRPQQQSYNNGGGNYQAPQQQAPQQQPQTPPGGGELYDNDIPF